MKKIKNKFLIVIIIFVVAILGVETYKSIVLSNIDRNSYVVLVKGEWLLNDNELLIDNKKPLVENDIIKTIWTDSLAIIKWWDWSITRMSGNSKIVINKTDIEKNLLNIQISFRLEKWKTWSDVISFIWKDSYFHQSFADTTAAVRWTTFEVNLDNNYLFVDKHEVKLTRNDWKTEVVSENKPFDLTKFTFIDFVKFIQTVQDKAWKKLNTSLDKNFYNSLIKNIWDININTLNKINDISNLTSQKKEELYNELLIKYQKINFVKADDIENYWKKIELKKELIALAWEKDKQNLLITTLYDFKDLVKNKQFKNIEKTFSILSENKSYLKNLDINISDYINLDLLNKLKFPKWLKQEFQNNFNSIKNTLNLWDINLKDNWLIDSTKKSFNDIKDNIDNLKNIIK